MYTHLNKPEAQVLLDVVNKSNTPETGLVLTIDQVAFSIPEVYSNPNPLFPWHNTRAIISANPDSELPGTPEFIRYRRLDVADILADNKGIIPSPLSGFTNTSEIAAAIRAAHGVMFTENSLLFEDVEITEFPASFTLRILPESLTYIGEVVLTLVAGNTLQDYLVNTDLDGLHLLESTTPPTVKLPELNDDGYLLVGNEISGEFATCVSNGEIEVFMLPGKSDGISNSFVGPGVSGYEISLAVGDVPKLAFGVAGLEGARDNLSLVDNYRDINVTLEHELGNVVHIDYVPQDGETVGKWVVREDETVPFEASIDGGNADSQILLSLPQISHLLPDAETDAEGNPLGDIVATFRASPHAAAWIPEIQFAITFTIL